MKRSQPRRSWAAARAKIVGEGRCRVCIPNHDRIDNAYTLPHTAHIIGREHDKKSGYKVLPERVVPLCPEHHRRYDPHTRGNDLPVDLWHLLDFEEQAQAIEDAGGYWLAVKRCAPVAYREFNEREAA